MPSPIKQLAGQTAIYGVSSILGRFLNYLLVPIHTRVFLTSQFGIVSELYTYIAFLLVLLLYGMETAFFRFYRKNNNQIEVYSTTVFSIFATTTIFLVFTTFFANDIAEILRYPDKSEYIIYLAFIIGFDAISAIPFAKLRAENKAKKFAIIKLLNIGIYIGLNLYFFWDFDNWQPAQSGNVSNVFIANLIASGATLALLLPQFLALKFSFSISLWKKMIKYAYPLLIFGFAGIINEMIDRILLKYMLPEEIAMHQVGIYGACYKISILMTIFIQAFRYAAEPFFFSKADDKNSKIIYAQVLKYFVITLSVLFIGVMLYIDIIKHFIGKDFHEGLKIVPILLLANLFLGVFYNLSVWYKLTDKTIYGAGISIFGAAITLILNIILIPYLGYIGSAWATFFCYASMMIASYFIGQKHFPINYPIKQISLYFLIALGIYFISIKTNNLEIITKYTVNSFLLISYVLGVYFIDKNLFKTKND